MTLFTVRRCHELHQFVGGEKKSSHKNMNELEYLSAIQVALKIALSYSLLSAPISRSDISISSKEWLASGILVLVMNSFFTKVYS